MFSIMNKSKVVTNLRIDGTNWLRLKTLAAEFNMSANEYINWIIDLSLSKAHLGWPDKSKKSIYDLLPGILKKRKKSKTYELSEDDKAIYTE